MKKRILALVLTLALGLSLAACAAPAADPSNSTDPSADPTASTEPSQAIQADLSQDILTFSAGELAQAEALLTVNGEVVPTSLFLYWLAFSCSYFENAYSSYGLTVAGYSDAILSDCCTMAAYYALLSQKVVEYACPLTDAQRASMLEELEQDAESYEQRKALYGLSDADIEFIYSVSDYYENLLQTLTREPTAEELNSYVYQAKHILLLTVDMSGTPTVGEDGTYAYPALTDEEVAQKRAQAEDLLAQLRASDDVETLFDALMNEHSEDSGLSSNPDGYVATTGQMVEPFETAALALEPGQVSEIVESVYGYHIILRGEVEDIEEYAADYRENGMDALVDQWLADAEMVQGDALEDLDIAAFYDRYTAWQAAYIATLDTESED